MVFNHLVDYNIVVVNVIHELSFIKENILLILLMTYIYILIYCCLYLNFNREFVETYQPWFSSSSLLYVVDTSLCVSQLYSWSIMVNHYIRIQFLDLVYIYATSLELCLHLFEPKGFAVGALTYSQVQRVRHCAVCQRRSIEGRELSCWNSALAVNPQTSGISIYWHIVLWKKY